MILTILQPQSEAFLSALWTLLTQLEQGHSIDISTMNV